MSGSNGVSSNGHISEGGLGVIASIPTQRKVRNDLMLIERIVDLGLLEVDRYGEVLDLCRTIRQDGERDIRDKLRASELETKLLALTFGAAAHSDKNHRLDNDQPTERIETRTFTVEFDQRG